MPGNTCQVRRPRLRPNRHRTKKMTGTTAMAITAKKTTTKKITITTTRKTTTTTTKKTTTITTKIITTTKITTTMKSMTITIMMKTMTDNGAGRQI